MTPLTICVMLASAAVAGAVLGASAALWVRRQHEWVHIAMLELEVASLQQRNKLLNAQVWAAIRMNYHQVIAVDLRRPDQ